MAARTTALCRVGLAPGVSLSRIEKARNFRFQPRAGSGTTSCKEAFEQMPNIFNEEAAKGLDCVYQFDLSGSGSGKWAGRDQERYL